MEYFLLVYLCSLIYSFITTYDMSKYLEIPMPFELVLACFAPIINTMMCLIAVFDRGFIEEIKKMKEELDQ